MEFYHFLPPKIKLLITYNVSLFFLFQKYSVMIERANIYVNIT